MGHADVLAEVKRAVAASSTEYAERSAVLRVLAKHGDVTIPTLQQTRSADGRGVKVYLWKGTKAGDFGLITGPKVQGRIATMAELSASVKGAEEAGIYVQAASGSDRAMQDTREAAEKIAAKAGRQVRESASFGARGRRSAGSASAAPAAPQYAAPMPTGRPVPSRHREHDLPDTGDVAWQSPIQGHRAAQQFHAVPPASPTGRRASRREGVGGTFEPVYRPPAPAPAARAAGTTSREEMMAQFKSLAAEVIAQLRTG